MKLWPVAIPCFDAFRNPTSYNGDLDLSGFAAASDALLEAGLLEKLTAHGHAIIGSSSVELQASASRGDPIGDLGSHGAMLAAEIAQAIEAGAQPLIAGGTCNHVSGILAGLQRSFGPDSRIGVLWFDAHGDINTPGSSASGLTIGMPLAVALGLCFPSWRKGAGMRTVLPSDRIVFVGARALDPWERQFIDASDAVITQIGAAENGQTADEAIAALAERVDHLYVHVDCDVLDRAHVPNLAFAEAGGPSIEQTSSAIRTAMTTGKVRVFGVVSFDPDGAGGKVTLDSAMTLIEQGVEAWA